MNGLLGKQCSAKLSKQLFVALNKRISLFFRFQVLYMGIQFPSGKKIQIFISQIPSSLIRVLHNLITGAVDYHRLGMAHRFLFLQDSHYKGIHSLSLLFLLFEVSIVLLIVYYMYHYLGLSYSCTYHFCIQSNLSVVSSLF